MLNDITRNAGVEDSAATTPAGAALASISNPTATLETVRKAWRNSE